MGECQVDECRQPAVDARRVSLGYGAWTRLVMCAEHGWRNPPADVPPFRSTPKR